LILFTGDLIDHSNLDLPVALAFCEKLRAIAPAFFCEGNHDRIDDAPALRAQMQSRGFDWLADGQNRTFSMRGRRIQVLGASWSFNPASHRTAVAACAARRDMEAFPILLAHHPDAFDAAAEAGFPLMLAGHSHGGQLMLTERLGAGPAAFNYWSGLYRKPGSSLVVSNGIGHWFPLRINAPAEIAVLRLIRAG
jgi:predicted MPP superfamily phosphohydrolase